MTRARRAATTSSNDEEETATDDRDRTRRRDDDAAMKWRDEEMLTQDDDAAGHSVGVRRTIATPDDATSRAPTVRQTTPRTPGHNRRHTTPASTPGRPTSSAEA